MWTRKNVGKWDHICVQEFRICRHFTCWWHSVSDSTLFRNNSKRTHIVMFGFWEVDICFNASPFLHHSQQFSMAISALPSPRNQAKVSTYLYLQTPPGRLDCNVVGLAKKTFGKPQRKTQKTEFSDIMTICIIHLFKKWVTICSKLFQKTMG